MRCRELSPRALPTAAPGSIARFRVRLEQQDGVWLDRAPIATSADAADRLRQILTPAESGLGAALLLDGEGCPLGYQRFAAPPCSASPDETRDLLLVALLSGAAAILLGHLSVRSDLAPRRADLDGIPGLVGAGRLLAVEVVDYLVLGGTGHYSVQNEFPELWHEAIPAFELIRVTGEPPLPLSAPPNAIPRGPADHPSR